MVYNLEYMKIILLLYYSNKHRNIFSFSENMTLSIANKPDSNFNKQNLPVYE